MPEGVENPEAQEPQEPEGQEPEGDATPDLAKELSTTKARLAGKDRALTAATQERDRLREEAAALSKWKAERENADLSEVERRDLRIKELETERSNLIAQHAREKAQRDYPLTYNLLGDRMPVDDDAFLAETEEKLKAQSEPEEPHTDPNQPRRQPQTNKPTNEKSIEELEADLKVAGYPYRA